MASIHPPDPEPVRPASHPWRVPALGAGLGLGYLVLAVAAPALGLALCAAVIGLAAALAPGLGASPGRQRVLVGITVWLALGLAGAWWLRAHAVGGLLWTVGTLFLLPLPVIPWLYASTFEDEP